jgi:hypothetical protein
MSTYRFAPVPSNSSVAAVVTTVVCAWFLVAAATILAEPTSGNRQRPAALESASGPRVVPVAIAPEAKLTITVVAQRLKPSATL